MQPPTSSKFAAVLRLWSLALALSVLLAAAAERWPEPLAPDPGLVWLLLAGPPLVLALGLLLRWRLPDPDRGESGDCAHGER